MLIEDKDKGNENYYHLGKVSWFPQYAHRYEMVDKWKANQRAFLTIRVLSGKSGKKTY